MAWPAFVQTGAGTSGPGYIFETGAPGKTRLRAVASRSLVWAATGATFDRDQAEVTSELGVQAVLPLPVTDQSGWREGDELIDVSEPDTHSHTYTITRELLDEKNRVVKGSFRQWDGVVIPTGSGPIDLDLLLPTTTVEGAKVSIPDSWSETLAEASQVVADAAGFASAAQTAAGQAATSAGQALEAVAPVAELAQGAKETADAAVPNTPEGRAALAASAEVSATFGEVVTARAKPLSTASTTSAGLPNGAPPSTMRDTGQPATTFGSIPMVVKDQAFTNEPVVIQNAASYYQSRTGSGRPVQIIEAEVRAKADSNTALVFILPEQPWAQGSVTRAEVHHTVYPSGLDTHTSVWTGSAENPIYYKSRVTPWNDGRWHRVAIEIDYFENTLTILHPGGEVVTLPPGSIDTSRISEYGVFEFYKQNPTGDAVPIEVRAFRLTERNDRVGLSSLGQTGRALSRSVRGSSGFDTTQATAGTVDYAFPMTLNVTLQRKRFRVPASGKVRVRVEGNIRATGTGALYFRVRYDVAGGTGNGQGGHSRQVFEYGAGATGVHRLNAGASFDLLVPESPGSEWDLVFSAYQSGGTEGAMSYLKDAATGRGFFIDIAPRDNL